MHVNLLKLSKTVSKSNKKDLVEDKMTYFIVGSD